MIAAIVDTETGGTEGPVVEVAVVHWSVQHACVISAWSSLVQQADNAAAHVNHIHPAALPLGLTPAEAMERTNASLAMGDVVLGWNVDFDKRMLESTGSLQAMNVRIEPLRWVDAMAMPWPNAKPYSKLHEVALSNGVGIVQVHRALADCLLIARLLERMVELGENVREMIEYAAQPRKLYQGLQVFADNHLAKDAGFRFDRATSRWLRQATASEVAALPFSCREAG